MRVKNKFMSAAAICLIGLVGSTGVAFADAAGDTGSGTPDAKQTESKVKPDGTSTTLSPPVVNGNNNYLDDRMMWNRSMPAWSYGRILDDPSHPDYCIPANTMMIGESSSLFTGTKTVTPKPAADDSKPATTPAKPGADGSKPATTAADGDKPAESPVTTSKQYLPVIVDPNYFFFKWFGGNKLSEANDALFPPANSGRTAITCEGIPNKRIVEGTTLYVASDDLPNTIRWGWDYGALVVPFKIQLSGKHTISSSSTLGGYFGYRFPLWDWGLVFSPIAFAGASNIATSATNAAGMTTSQTVAGLSFGGGVITRVKDSGFQLGLIFGVDHVNSAQPYAYNDKVWASLEIGYSFAQ